MGAVMMYAGMLAGELLTKLRETGLPTSYTYERKSAYSALCDTWDHRVGTVLPADEQTMPHMYYTDFHEKRSREDLCSMGLGKHGSCLVEYLALYPSPCTKCSRRDHGWEDGWCDVCPL
jgi:hypothetical protein